ncbi:hypothetical protein [Leifsonia xyli]|uniref:hypothetical protein n=1 Tax=Leifsonia xyli TaxID=1575 RepID=UPI003D67AEF3
MSWVSTLDIHGWGDPTDEFVIASENLGRFAASGGRVLYGTDLGNGPLAVGVNARELRALLDAGVHPDTALRSIAGLRRPEDDRAPTIGAHLAWVPTPPPAADDTQAALPDWLASARGLTVAQLLASPRPDAHPTDAHPTHAHPTDTHRDDA